SHKASTRRAQPFQTVLYVLDPDKNARGDPLWYTLRRSDGISPFQRVEEGPLALWKLRVSFRRFNTFWNSSDFHVAQTLSSFGEEERSVPRHCNEAVQHLPKLAFATSSSLMKMPFPGRRGIESYKPGVFVRIFSVCR
ncbi:hypothetical protein CLAIMM_05533, partial [Cladophialophora immunda]